MFSSCSFRYVRVNSLWVFLRFCTLAFVGFLLLNEDTIFMLSCFFPDFGLVGMHSADGCKWAVTKFSCSSSGVCVSDISERVSYLFFTITVTLTKWLEKKLDSSYTRMLQAILNKSWWQHPTRHQLYGHLPPITKTIKVRRARHAGYCWRSRDELISDVLLWNPSHGRAKAGRPA